MIDPKCSVCKNPDRRRAVELMWNGKMTQAAIVRVVQEGITSDAVTKHLKFHTDGDANARRVDVAPELPTRVRIENMQRLQLDEFERRIELAQHRADLRNALHEGEDDWTPVDWSDFFDVLGKDGQAAISSILKAQGLTDKREAKTADLKLGLFEAMAKSGLAPKALVGDVTLPALGPGDDDGDD